MTNLPIISNSTPPVANAANAALANGAADAKPADGASDASPFAALLAQQMGGADAALLNIAQISIGRDTAGSDAAQGSQGAADSALIGAMPADAASSVMALLMQIPQETRPAVTRAAEGTTVSSTGMNSTSSNAADVALLKAVGHGDAAGAMAGGSQIQASDAQGLASGKADILQADQKIASDAFAQDIAKLTELPAGQATQASANAAQTVAPSALAAAMPNVQPGKTDNPQTISTPLGSSGWSDEFSQKINWMSTQKNQIAELHLNPPDLGPLDVVLKVSDNQATALFTSPHGAVREAVESALPRLREMLADSGITLGNTTVSDQPPRDRDTQGFTGQGSGTGTQRGEGSGGVAAPEGASTAAVRPATVRSHNGMVDTFA